MWGSKLAALAGTTALAVSMLGGTPAQADTAERRAGTVTITATATKSEVVLGKRVVITGTTKPRAKGATVLLQQRGIGEGASKRWKTQKKGTVNRKGKFTLKDKPTTATPRKYRVVLLPTAQFRKSVSKPVKVTVFEWKRLTSLGVRDSQNVYAGRADVDGVSYPDSIWGSVSSQVAWRDWNVTRDCLRLRTTVGLGDGSETGSSALIQLEGDGLSLYSKSFGLAQSEQVTVSLEGVFRLLFRSTSTNPASPTNVGAVGTLGTPEVLCTDA